MNSGTEETNVFYHFILHPFSVMWRTPEELLEIGLRRSRIVMMNEACDRLKRCIRTRQIGQRILPIAHNAGVRHLAMETLSPFFVDEANLTRQLPEVGIGMGYLHQPDWRAFIQAALDLGWTLISYKINSQAYPSDEPLSMEYTNLREEEQAKKLICALEAVPSDAPLLVWCGNGHSTKTVVGDWMPMGYQFKQLSGIDPFVIDQVTTVKFSKRSPEQQQNIEQFLRQFATELVKKGGTAGFLREETPPSFFQSREGADAFIVSFLNDLE